MAQLVGVERKTISRWENGHTVGVTENLSRVAGVLGIPVADAFAAANGAPDVPLPAPLPRTLARLVEIFSEMTEPDRADLLQRVDWVNEWAEARLARSRQSPPKTSRRVV